MAPKGLDLFRSLMGVSVPTGHSEMEEGGSSKGVQPSFFVNTGLAAYAQKRKAANGKRGVLDDLKTGIL